MFCLSFLCSLTRFEGAAVKASRPDDGGQAEEGAQVQTELVCFLPCSPMIKREEGAVVFLLAKVVWHCLARKVYLKESEKYMD